MSSNQESMKLKVRLGDRIEDTISQAIALCKTKHAQATFTFNGIELTVNADSVPEAVRATFLRLVDEAAVRYKLSPEYKEAQNKRQIALLEQQLKIDQLMRDFDTRCITPEATVEWVGDFAAINDDSGLVFDRKSLIEKLEALGYEANAYVGEDATSNKIAGAKYIVGQALDHLSRDFPMHPMLADFAKDYLSRDWGPR